MPDVTATPDGDAFLVRAVVRGATHSYRVRVGAAEAARFGAPAQEIARATIAFLLDREPPTSILTEFDCTVVPRYFPDYREALSGYLAGEAG